MQRHHLHKISIAIVALLCALGLSLVLINSCGQNPPASSATASEGVTVKGLATAPTSGSAGIHTLSALDGATVTISKCTAGSFDTETLATGTTNSDGTYSIEIPADKIKTDYLDGNEKLNNIIVTITKGETTVGAVINSLTVTATDPAYAPTADSDSYKKSLIARKAFEQGMDPKNFDFDSKIDRKFDDMSGYSDSDLTKFDNMAGAIKDADAVRDDIATGLGISATILAQLDAKGKEYHETYIKPIFKAAFEAKTPPDQKQLDEAFSNMEKYMKDYAISLGITDQQFLDLKNMYDQQMQNGMKKGMGEDDNAYKEMKRRDMGSKMLDLFKAQWDAADYLASIAPTGGTSFKDNSASAAAYANFLSAATTIATALKDKLNDTSITNPGLISDTLRVDFFDAFIFPPKTEMPDSPEEVGAIMNSYANTRIMVYFMSFFSESVRNQMLGDLGSKMQPVFQKRFQDTTSPYYMGPEFWGNTTPPTPAQIQARLEAFKTALDTAVNDAIKTPFESVFGAASDSSKPTQRLINAFKILNAPPDAF